MKDAPFAELMESVRQAGRTRRGKSKPARVATFKPADIRAVRAKLGKTQVERAWQLPTDKELLAQMRSASAREREAAKREPRARAARYDRAHDMVVIELTSGALFAFPPRLAQGLTGASAEDLSEVEVTPMGDLHWERLDADMSVLALLQGTFGTKAWMRELARTGGRSRSAAKVRAARAKGGRPRKRSANA